MQFYPDWSESYLDRHLQSETYFREFGVGEHDPKPLNYPSNLTTDPLDYCRAECEGITGCVAWYPPADGYPYCLFFQEKNKSRTDNLGYFLVPIKGKLYQTFVTLFIL